MALPEVDMTKCTAKCCCYVGESTRVYECNNPCGDLENVSNFQPVCCDCPSFLPCNGRATESGGEGLSTYCYGILPNSTILFSYEAFQIKDRFTFSGIADFDTGFVSGQGEFTIPVDASGGTLVLDVNGLDNTAWEFSLYVQC